MVNMKTFIFVAMLLIATSAHAEGWNESFMARDVTDHPQYHNPSPKRVLTELLLVKMGIIDERSPFVGMNPLDGPEYTGKIETSYKIRLSRSRIYVGVHVRF